MPTDQTEDATVADASRDPLIEARRLLTQLAAVRPEGRAEVSAELQRCLQTALASADSIAADRAVLLQQQVALRTVISSVPFFVFWKDRECVYRGCNDIFARLGGLKHPDEIVGRTDYDMPWTKEQSDLYREDDFRVMTSGQPKLDIEEANLDADGNEKVILTSKVPLQAADGRVIGMLGIFADITARKQMEKDLSRAKELAESASRAKSDFLASVGHELRTPLALVLGPLDSVLARADLSPEVTLELKRVQRNAIRLKSLMDDVLDFAKADAGKTDPHDDALDAEEAVRSLVDDIRAAATTRGLEISAVTAPTGLLALDRRMFEKILLNLIGNALKFTPAGGKIRVTLDARPDVIELAVQDTGIGIADQDLGRLFQRFQQVDSSSTRRYEGTGLGLALVKQFAELMGGSVGVESKLGCGSRFFVKLPRRAYATNDPSSVLRERRQADHATLNARFAEPVVPRPLPANGGVARGDLPLIVLAEDNSDLRTYLVSLLEPEYRVIALPDGAAALAAASQHLPDVIVTDVMMPEMDGYELLSRLKSSAALREIPVILLTALASQDALAASLAQGAADFLNKPFRPSELLARVGVAARLSLAHKQLSQRNAAMRLVLDNVDQGLLTIDAEGRVSEEHSATIDRWFGFSGERPLFRELLAADQGFADAFDVGFDGLTAGLLPRELCVDQLPRRLVIGAREYTCRYLSVTGAPEKTEILAIIDDVTDQLRIAAERAEQNELLAVYIAVMRDRAGFVRFFDQGSRGIQALAAGRHTPAHSFLHLLKGDAAMLGLGLTAELCHRAEDDLAAGERLRPQTMMALTGLWAKVGGTLRALLGESGPSGVEIPREEIQRFGDDIRNGISTERLLKRLACWGLEPAEKTLARMADYARHLAADLRRAELSVEVVSDGLRVDPERWTPIWSGLLQMVRNAVDHGIEDPDERRRAGKPAQARLRLTTSLTAEQVQIEVTDDGRGIDWARIQQLATERGLPAGSASDLVDAIFAPGFSTRHTATATSGRGIGLAAIADTIRALGGQITVESQLGSGSVWRMCLPKTTEHPPVS